jgi:hypothetical protein
MRPAGGDQPPSAGGIADWGLARVVEHAGITGVGGATVRADSAARTVLADICTRADARRRTAADRLDEAVLVYDAGGRLPPPTGAACGSWRSTRPCWPW